MDNSYDTIVVGLGGMGSAAAYHLSKRGQCVLGLDAHHRNHTQGSSHGSSRIIREASNKGATEYVPLAQRAYELWHELEEESGRDLLSITGGLVIGEPEGDTIAGEIRSAQQYDLAYEQLSSAEVSHRFPAFRLPDNLVAVFEQRAGILQPEACVEAHLDLAASYGADLRFSEPVYKWEVNEAGVQIETSHATYEGKRLVVTVGPWASELLSDLQLPLFVERVVNVHFEPLEPSLFTVERCPVYTLDVPEGWYYGIPLLPDQGVKFGGHNDSESCTPHTIRREIDSAEIEALRKVLNRYLPGSAGIVRWALTCMYTMTPDGHFIVDRHPLHSQVVYGCGFSGHGFKYTSVIGEVLADLATEGETRHPIRFLSSSRFYSQPLRSGIGGN